MQIQNLQINHVCLHVFLKPEKTLMFFVLFLLVGMLKMGNSSLLLASKVWFKVFSN